MYYTIYQITNNVNGKVYIGKHQTENIDDGYFGSGIALKRAIAYHGKDNFTKEILHIFESEDDMNAKEKELITEEFVARKDTYNLGVGGEGGPHFKGKTHSAATKKKLSKLAKGRIASEETRNKISASNRRRTVSDDTKRKLSILSHIRNGKSLEEAEKLADNRNLLITPRLSRSEAQKKHFSIAENRNKKSEQMKRLHLEYDFDKIKQDIKQGLRPKEIREKYNMTKNRYDYLFQTYLK